MKEQIEQALCAIVGMPLWSMGRVADLEWFHFGPRRRVSGRRGEMKEVGAYALHVQCAWRIVGPTGIVVGSRDRFYPAGDDPYDEPPDFDWDRPGANRRDQQTYALIAASVGQPVVIEAVQVDRVVGIKLAMTGGLEL